MPLRTEACTLPREYVCTEYTTYDIAEMGDIVHIGKSAGDKDVPSAFLRQGLTLVLHLEGFFGGNLEVCSAGASCENVA